MSFIKIGENLNFSTNNIKTAQEALMDPEVAERFVKLAKQLKKVAPKAEDFVYGHAIIMHSSEASLIDQNTGNPKLNAKGQPVKGWFENVKLANGKESVKWVSEDGIKPYKNHNGDSFPEAELKKAHKLWIGRPLCKDHVSDTVDGVRGIIVDTYYDERFKRIHALFALDKKNYPDLAQKVTSGYANSVSMGCAVGRSCCYECNNVATTEKEYCQHVKTKNAYAEINLDLNPIELSLVVTPADSLAKIKHVIASMNSYVQEKQESIEKMKQDRCVNPTELQQLSDSLKEIQAKLQQLTQPFQKAGMRKIADDLGELVALRRDLEGKTDEDSVSKLKQVDQKIKDLLDMETENKELPDSEVLNTELPVNTQEPTPQATPATMGAGLQTTNPEYEPTNISLEPARRLASIEENQNKVQGALFNELGFLRSKLENINETILNLSKVITKEENNMNSARLKARAKMRRAYWLGGGGVNEPTPGKPKYEKEDYQSIRDKEDKQMVGEPLETGSEGMHPGDKEVKEKLSRASLSESELEARRLQRRAYFQGGGGVNEPTPGKVKYEKEDADSIRNKQDKQMVGEPLETGNDGLMGDDLAVKQKLLRAKLSAKLTKVADGKGGINKGASRWEIFADDKMILSATATEAFEDEVNENWDFFASRDYGTEVMKSIRSEGFGRTAYLLKGAEEAPAAAEPVAPAVELPAAPTPVAEENDAGMNEKVNAALSVMEEKIAELRDLVAGESDELVDVDMKSEQAPMDKVLATKEDLMKVEALLDESADELALISETLEGLDKVEASVQPKLLKAAGDALSDSEAIVSEANLVIEAAKKKKVKKTKKVEKKEEKADKKEMKEEKAEKADKEDKKDEKEAKAQELLDRALKVRAENRAALLKAAMEAEQEMMALTPEKEVALEKLLDEEKMEKDPQGNLMHPDLADDTMEVSEADDAPPMMANEDGTMCAHGPEEAHSEACAMDKMADRKAARAKLVEEAQVVLAKSGTTATEPTFFLAHPKGGTVTELTTKTEGAKVETIEEQHAAMLEVAQKQPTDVRLAAVELQEQIVKGALKADDLDKLVAEGKADAAAVAYFKKFFAQALGAGSFGADLSKEFATKKKEASDNTYKIKLRRAYDVAVQAQDKGLISVTREALDNYVDEIMNFDDAAFESNKRVVANFKASKKSGALPRVGMDAATKAMNVTASVNNREPDLSDLLGSLGWK